MGRSYLRGAAAFALLLLTGASPAPEPQPDQLAFTADRADRMTVQVSIGGKGPYRFFVDTGSERTVIAEELARHLALDPGRSARMHSMSGVDSVGTVVIPELKVARRKVTDIHAPALARANLGAEGLLGVDSLRQQNVLFDFRNRTIKIARSRGFAEEPGAIIVKGKSRFGHLIITDARVDGQRVWVIVDTGAQVSIGNGKLRQKLAARGRLGQTRPIDLISVTGALVRADLASARGVAIGGLTLKDMPIAFAEVHPFRKLDLTDQPALLLGMDALRAFDSVAIDFAQRKVRFAVPRAAADSPVRMASSAHGARTLH